MCDGQAVGRTVGRSGAVPRAARREPRTATLLPLPVRCVPRPPCGSRRRAALRSLRLATYCRTALLPPPLQPPPLLYRAVLQSSARLGTPTSSPRRNFAALAAPGEGGAEGGGNGAPLSLPNSCDVCRAAAAAPPTSRDSVLGVDVRVGPERDVFLKHGLLIKENYQTNKCDFRKYSKKSCHLRQDLHGLDVKSNLQEVSIRDTNKKKYPVFI